MESKAIRLTNKTAVALRENAKKTRNAYFIVGAVGTLALLGAAVYFGMQWLPAVPPPAAAARRRWRWTRCWRWGRGARICS